MATLPVKKVVVMEDRAQVERRGTVALSGVTKLEIEGLPLVAVDRSLKLEVKGGTFIDAKFERRWKEQPKGGLPADASALRTKVKTLEQQKLAQADGVARLDARAEVLLHRAGRSAAVDLRVRGLRHQRSRAVEVAARRTLGEAGCARRGASPRPPGDAPSPRCGCQEARTALGAAEEPLKRVECVLALTLEGNGEAQVRASYLVPCAVWRPAYRATLTGEQVQVEAEGGGLAAHRRGLGAGRAALLDRAADAGHHAAEPGGRPAVPAREAGDREARGGRVDPRRGDPDAPARRGGTPEMPGLDDGGETRLLRAAGATTITATASRTGWRSSRSRRRRWSSACAPPSSRAWSS